jgi:ATP-dependent protease ClpP protease subunit
MKKFLSILLILAATLSVALPATADVELRLRTGATWRGDVGDTVRIVYTERGVDVEHVGEVVFVSTSPAYVTIKAEIAGKVREKTVFGTDIKVLEGVERETKGPVGGGDAPDRFRPESRRAAPGSKLGASGGAGEKADDIPRDDLGRPIGVFVLPLEGGVGQEFRHDEIVELTKYIDDNYGPGQTIVLFINSNGGLVLESLDIAEAIFEARKRHRVVAWVDKAISAGCFTAMSCYEIYFRSAATAGSVTTLAGGQSLQGPEVEQHVEHFAELAEKSGYSPYIARAMKLNRFMCSYDKDPETGEITWYDDLRGEFDLSTDEQNLSFNSQNAEHSGFSKGTADTGEELAKLLGMPRWVEIDDYGREIATDWAETYKRLQKEFAEIMYELQYKNQTIGDPMVVMNTQLQAMRKIVRYYDQYPRIAWLTFGGNSPEQGKKLWEQRVEELRRAIARMRGR